MGQQEIIWWIIRFFRHHYETPMAMNGGNYADSPGSLWVTMVFVYVANQVTVSTNLPVTILSLGIAPLQPILPWSPFSGTIAPGMRLGVTMDIRGTGRQRTNHNGIVLTRPTSWYSPIPTVPTFFPTVLAN